MATASVLRALIAAAPLFLLIAGPAAGATPDAEARELRLEQLKEELALTEEQQARIKPLVEQRNAKLREIRDRHAGDASRSAERAMLREMREVQSGFDAQLQPILNEQQRDQLQEMRVEARKKARDRLRERQQ